MQPGGVNSTPEAFAAAVTYGKGLVGAGAYSMPRLNIASRSWRE